MKSSTTSRLESAPGAHPASGGGCRHLLNEEKFFIVEELRKQNYRHFVNEVLRHNHLLRMLPANSRTVIDVGCGTGYLASLMARSGKTVTAIDISQPRLVAFRDIAQRYDITQVHADLFDLDYRHAFDALVCQEVLEHLEHFEQATHHMVSFLKPQGYALFCVPYRENLSAKMRTCPVCHTAYHTNGHLHSFDERKLSETLQRHGFTILRIRRIVSKRTTKWCAKIRYPVERGFFLIGSFDSVMNYFFPRKAAYLAVLCRKNTI